MRTDMTEPPAPRRTIHVLNGPNLDRLGRREPGIYGTATLETIRQLCEGAAGAQGCDLAFRQSAREGELIEWLHRAEDEGAVGVVLNAAAYTHTSVALHDAIRSIDVPVVEVHLSNVHAREPFRHHSMIAGACRGVVCGFGAQSYVLAIQALAPLPQEG